MNEPGWFPFRLVCWGVVVLFLTGERTAFAQLAPTGTHYAGRTSDTGHSGVSGIGAYAASVPVEFPAARGGLDVPVAITYGQRGVGAAGLGWDVPLSYVRRDATVSRRRPAYDLDRKPKRAREQVVVSIGGRTIHMVKDGNLWVGRDVPGLELRSEANNTWRLLDGNGRQFVFTQLYALSGSDLWLLTSVSAANQANRIDLEYLPALHYFSGGSGISIDLVSVRYNTHPNTPGCTKDEIRLDYDDAASEPLALSLLGDFRLVRMRTLREITVLEKAGCTSGTNAIRRYRFTYTMDPDTGLPRLADVKIWGREGTDEASVPLPVAAYEYGSATIDGKLKYQRGTDILLPAELSGTPRIADMYHDGGESSPDGGETHVSWQNFVDFTGDGLPDLVYRKNDQLWLARNLPDGIDGITNTLSAASSELSSSVYSNRPLASHSSESLRYDDAWQNQDHVWRQTIDVNGDGRLDIIDAAEKRGSWMVYLNTPGTQSGKPVTWVRREFRVGELRRTLEGRGHVIEGDHVPLSRRTTGFDVQMSECWEWDWDAQKYKPYTGPHQCGPIVAQEEASSEKTFTEWEVKDINGDGYPDILFNSSPVRIVDWQPDIGTPRGDTYWHVLAKDELRPTAGGANSIMAVLNVVGVRFDSQDPFSAPFVIADNVACGVGLWVDDECPGCGLGADTIPDQQHQVCGIADVNGDRLADRIHFRDVYLGSGDSFSNPQVAIRLPGVFRQLNQHESECTGNPATIYDPEQIASIRDLTGDGIPDFIETKPGGWHVSIGNGVGFAAPIRIEVPAGMEFSISRTFEDCTGKYSHTMGGLYDVNGDGQPEVVRLVYNPTRLEVYHLAGGLTGNPQAGRLTTINNGYGAISKITYRSAKERGGGNVPFPEIVVTAVETLGTHGLGGRMSAVRYAYGYGEFFFDPASDAFVMRSYGKAVETYSGGSSDGADFAIIRMASDLPEFNPAMSDAERFARYQMAGRTKDTFLTVNASSDPWEVLATVQPYTDIWGRGGTHHEWSTQYILLAEPELATNIDSFDVPYPYDWAASFGSNGSHAPGAGRGFTYEQSTMSWRGTQPPGSSASNVQTQFEVTQVDDFGNVLAAKNGNDRFRSDDDLCIEMTYATPTTAARILSAPATRRLTNCLPGPEERTLSIDTWEYDALPVGSVAFGRTTSHIVQAHATDDSEAFPAIREFEADHDSVGNPNYVVTAREDGTVRALGIQYDEFGLVPISTTLNASGLAPVITNIVRDPVSLAVVSTTDANGTTWGVELDGFERTLRTTVTPPGGALGVVSTTTYEGFNGPAPNIRSIRTKAFRDPVPPPASADGVETIVRLDELGRTRRVEQLLGDSYDHESLVVVSRAYDGLGRVSFDADPHPKSQNSATAYGTTYHFSQVGDLHCAIRGSGAQPLTSSSNPAAEIFPTCFSTTYENHTARRRTSKPDALHAGSPQHGVVYLDTLSATGSVLSRETISTLNNGRVELSSYSYDHLGQLVSLVRYGNPSAGFPTVPTTQGEPVQWKWRLDSRGQTLAASEPEMASRYFAYSNWGELLRVSWTDTSANWPIPMQLVKSYDALGRISRSTELIDSNEVPDSRYEWIYDSAPETTLPSATFTKGRLTQTKSAIGDMHLSYDAFGRVEARAFEANGESYFERYEHRFDGSLTALEVKLSDTGYQTERYEYEYDSALRLRQVTDVSAFRGGSTELYSVDRPNIDAWGRVRSAKYGQSTTYDAIYANTGRRLPLENTLTTGSGSRRTEYLAYDALGRELERRESAVGEGEASTTNRYDELGRLAQSSRTGREPEFDTSFTYDALGNLRQLDEQLSSDVVNLAFSANNADRDRVCRVDFGSATTGPCNVFYDGSGNVIEQPTPNGTRTLEFYPSGAVKSIYQGATTASFRYDGSGEMFELDVVGGFLQDPRSDRRYGLIEHRVVDGNSTIVRQIPGPNGIIASRRGEGGPWVFPFGEDRGTRFVSNDDSFVQEISYLPFGKAISTGAGPGDPEYTSAQWNGGDALLDLGVVHVGARLYDPSLGRFLSRDPLIIPRTAASTNPYAFALNDPVNFSDPSGLDCESPTGSCNPAPIVLPIGLPGGSDNSAADAVRLVLGPTLLPASNSLPIGEGIVDTVWQAVHEYHPYELNRRFLQRVYNVAVGNVTLGRALRAQVGDSASVAAAMISGGTWLRAVASGFVAGGGAAVQSGSLSRGVIIGVLATGGARVGDKIAARLAARGGGGGGAGNNGGGTGGGASGTGGGASGGGVQAGEAGRFASLRSRAVVGDGLTPHHMPQDALSFTSRADGGALVMNASEHVLTRTHGARGRVTARVEAGLSFRDVLARDIRDVRQIVGSKYNQGLRDLLQYYRDYFPDLIGR